ncbi:MAG: hypothetical protein AAGD07_22775 [Planctomycetota bacterium]
MSDQAGDRPSSARQFAILMALVLFGTSSAGCRLCADCDLESYAAYGGVMQRTQRDSGRVGSVFDSGGTHVANLEPRTPADEADAALREQASEESESDNEVEDESFGGDESSELDDLSPEERDERDRRRLEEMELQDIRYDDRDAI